MKSQTNKTPLGPYADTASIDMCFTLADLLFAQIGALANAELRKLLLRDVVERGVEALDDQP